MRARVRKPEKTVLLYGLTDSQWETLAASCQEAGIRCRRLTDGELDSPVAGLLSGTARPAVAPAEPLEGKFALLDGFEGKEDSCLDRINAAAPGVIKAIHTAHNSGWTFRALCRELAEEHRTMNA